MAAARTRRINFRTMLHVLPYHNPLVLAARSTSSRCSPAAATSSASAAATAGSRCRPAMPLDETSRPRYEEALDLFVEALHNDVVSFEGEYWNVKDSQVIPLQRAQVPRRPRRHLRPHVRPRGEARLGGRGAAAPPVRRAQGAARPLPREVRGVRHDAGHHLDPRLLHRRRRASSRGARRSGTCAASSRATRRR